VFIHIRKVFLQQLANKLASLTSRNGVAETSCNLCGEADENLGGNDAGYSILILTAF
jgi:hypothetical protein